MNWLKIPEGEDVKITILEPLYQEHIFVDSESYKVLIAEQMRDCPLCKAGIPFSDGKKT